MLAGVRAVQELDTCWVAESSLRAVSRLRRRGVACEVLDQSPAGKAYFLVRVPRSATSTRSGTRLRLAARGGSLSLLSGGENVRELLPSGFVIKRLSGSIPVPVTLGPPITGGQLFVDRSSQRSHSRAT